jgi:hypothetical protein
MSRSITPAVPGSLSPEFITVPSSTGFSVGDYVYQKNGDYGVPPATGLSAPFTINPSSVVYGATVGGTATPLNSLVFGSTTSGGSTGQCAAKLSNGNIVIVYRKPLTTVGVYFRIVDANNGSVVGETVVSTAITAESCGPIGVIALTGGGFVVHYPNNSTNKLAYGVYTNTGAVTTAFAIDTTFPVTTITGRPLAGCALPNGGFALVTNGSGGGNVYLRAFDSVGVGAYAWTSVDTNASGYGCSVAARSDNSVCVFWLRLGTTASYELFNSGGGTITTGNITVSNAPASTYVVCLTNDTFVLGYQANGASTSYRFRLLPVGNVLGGEILPPLTNMAQGTFSVSNQSSLIVKELSSGGFVYFMNDNGGGLYYVFYNSAGTALYSIPKPLSDINCFNSQFNFYIGIVETPTDLSLYYSGAWPIATGATINDLYNTKINLTDYSVVASLTTNTSVGTVSASVGAYSKATSLPTKAAYTAANTETLTLDTSVGYVVSPQAVAPLNTATPTVDSIKSTTLPDGRFAIVYKNSVTGVINFNVYSIAGVLQTTVLVGTGSTGVGNQVRIAALSSGKIAVAHYLASGNIVLNVYSTTYALLGTTSVSSTGSAMFDIAGTKDDRVALAYQASSGIANFSVFSNTATLIFGPNQIASVNPSNFFINVGVSENGTIWVNVGGSSQSSACYYYYASGATTYSGSAAISHTTNISSLSRSTMAVSPTNIVAVISRDATTNTAALFALLSVNNGATIQNKTVSGFSTSGLITGNLAIGCTGAGSFVWFGSGNASANLYGFTGVESIVSATTQANYALLSGITPNGTNMQACITPSYGYNAVISWIDTSNIAQYAIVCAYPYTSTQNIIAGTTTSLLTTTLDISNSSGYYLAGIAVTDCPPGGTGQVQTNGIANLNSQYSASTAYQGFDFQNPVTVGVKGTVIGRTVTMIKD